MKKNTIHILIIVLSCLFILFSCKKKETEEDGKIKHTGKSIVETGELAAVNSKGFMLIPSPNYYFRPQIIGILEHGAIVHPGDSIIQIDPTELNKSLVNNETALENQMAALEKLHVDHANKINDLESNFKNAQASYDLKKISLEASRFESERFKKIKELEFEQEKISLERDKRKIELNRIINYNDLKIQEIRVNQIKKQIQSLYDAIKNLTIRTQYEGVFQVNRNPQTQTIFKVGDNAFWGYNLANVPELSKMKVTTFINENDFIKIYTGQKVIVRLDALPSVSFDGEISYIGKLCYLKEQNSRQKVFDVEVAIFKTDERLKPGMTVSCEFLDCK
jgi:multidrug efflux pump subunit AcrA (membrane-fusion protein)